MIRRTGSWAVAAALAIGLAVALAVSLRVEYAIAPPIAVPPASTSGAAAAPSTDPGPSADPDAQPVPTQATPTLSRPSSRSIPIEERLESPSPTRVPESSQPPQPDRSVHINSRYATHYAATPASWDRVIDSGKSLPDVTDQCARSWRASGKDRRLNWDSVRFMCLNDLPGSGYRPQGVGGSGTTERYLIGGKPAADRNLILTSWYSPGRERGVVGNGRVTRLVVMDMDQRRYNTVELVRPGGSRTLRNLGSHGSGLVWAGQYLYSSSRSELWMYNADDILEIDGHFVLPAVARWTVRGQGGLSSISLDRSTTPDRLRGIKYSKASQAYIQSFDLAEDGSLAPNSRRSDVDLSLTNRFGQRGPAVHSAASVVIPGGSYQGVAGSGPLRFANSSSLRINGGKGVDAVALLKGDKVVGRFRMPHGNGQSIFIDYRRGTYVSITERGSQFLFELPLKRLTKKAE